jgi:osmotically-inducible protein OsmY
MLTEAEQEAPLSRHVAAVAEARLGASSHRALRTIFCTCDQGVLVLRGRLSTYFHKQLAQEIVADIEGVEQVVNQIEVVSRAT